jgi:hypothetical protein
MRIALGKVSGLQKLAFERTHFSVDAGESDYIDFGKLVFCVKLVGVMTVSQSLLSCH